MLELAALLLCALLLFLFGISAMSIIAITLIMLISFILLSTLSFVFKFGFWILLAVVLYYFVVQKNK